MDEIKKEKIIRIAICVYFAGLGVLICKNFIMDIFAEKIIPTRQPRHFFEFMFDSEIPIPISHTDPINETNLEVDLNG